jgi:hypothetical protein
MTIERNNIQRIYLDEVQKVNINENILYSTSTLNPLFSNEVSNLILTGNSINWMTASNSTTASIVIDSNAPGHIVKNNFFGGTRAGLSIIGNSISSTLKDTISNNLFNDVTYFAIKTENTNTYISGNRINRFNGGEAFIIRRTNGTILNNYINGIGPGLAKGISIQNDVNGIASNALSILHNSINITTNDPVNGRALEITGGQNIIVKNNIFSNNGGGYAAYISPIPPNLNIDYNNYFSTGNEFGYINGTEYSSIASWELATAQDANSLSVPPFFTSDTTLVPNHVLLNNTGELLAEVTLDIDGTLRGVFPDLGAKEFSPCQPDVGINRFVNLQNPIPGQNNITVELQNQGTSVLNEVSIHWSVNGVEQAAFTWTGNLATTANTNVNIGTYNLSAGTLYQLQA